MQTFFLIVLGLYSALVLLRFGVNMWNMLTLNATKYNLIQLLFSTLSFPIYRYWKLWFIVMLDCSNCLSVIYISVKVKI